jgi:hypothetical protein
MAYIYSQLIAAQFENLASDPASTASGLVYFNTTSNISKYYNGSAWKTFLAADFSNVTGTLAVANGGTGVTTSTGSGNVVLSTSPTLVTPALGTPSSATLTNATGLPIDGGTTGTLPISRGGTGNTSQTAAFDALAPTTTTGDISYHNGTDNVRLPIGTDGQALSVSGGLPAWAAVTPTLDSSADQLNLAISCSVGSSALTIALKDKAGSDPSAGSPVKIGFRNATATNGTYNTRSVTGSLSVVVSSGSTLGHASGIASDIFVYAIDNSGTVELAVSSTLFETFGLKTTTAEGGSGAADSATTLYSTTARSNVPMRLLGKLISTQTTAGTWAAVPTETALGGQAVGFGMATSTQSGLVSTTTQTFAGAKTFSSAATFSSSISTSGLSNSGSALTSSVVGNQFSASSNTNGTAILDVRNSNSTDNTSTTALSVGLVGSGTFTAAEYIRFYDGDGINTRTGAIHGNGTSAVNYATSSDERLKENINNLDNASELVKCLQPRTWTWKKDQSNGVGFVAQELLKVWPSAVSKFEDTDAMLAVDYGKLTPLLAAAIKELLTKVEILENKISNIENNS